MEIMSSHFQGSSPQNKILIDFFHSIEYENKETTNLVKNRFETTLKYFL